jgi:hypothetical protein
VVDVKVSPNAAWFFSAATAFATAPARAFTEIVAFVVGMVRLPRERSRARDVVVGLPG